jgi:hypothetical protein
MAHSQDFNYNASVLRDWCNNEVKRLKRKEGLEVQDFCDRLSEHFPSGEFTRMRLNKFRAEKDQTKTLTESVLQAFNGYRNRYLGRETLDQTKAWVGWQSPKSAGTPKSSRKLKEIEGRVDGIEEQLDELKALEARVARLTTIVTRLDAEHPHDGKIFHPFVSLVHEKLHEAAVNVFSEEGMARIEKALDGEEDQRLLIEILEGDELPSLVYGGALLALVQELAGSDAVTPDMLKALRVLPISQPERIPEIQSKTV